MSDGCDIIVALITCCIFCGSSAPTYPIGCTCCCKKKQDEDLEMVSPELVQDQPRRKDPMIANDMSREVAANHVQEQRGGQNNTG